MSRNPHLPILPTPGLADPRFTRLRFMTADAGAAGTAGASDASATDAASAVDSDATGTTDTGTANAAGSQADQGADADSPWSDPNKAKAEIERLRRENAADRTNAKQTAAQEARDALAQDIGKALGLVKDDSTTTDPAALATAAQEATEKAREAQVELAVYKAAGAAEKKADPAALLDSRAFLASVHDLDPTAADFQTKIGAAIKAAVEANPKLAAQEAAAASPRRTAVDTGGTGERRNTAQPSSLNAAVSAAYSQQ